MRSSGIWVLRFVIGLARRATVGAIVGAIVMVFPLPADIDPLWRVLQAPVGALLIVCFIGKALFDTLFYDRYRP